MNELSVGLTVENREKNEITITLEEYAKLKDIQTRFEILKNEFIHASYCPIHHQIILGIEKEYEHQKNVADFLNKQFHIPTMPEPEADLKKQEGE